MKTKFRVYLFLAAFVSAFFCPNLALAADPPKITLTTAQLLTTSTSVTYQISGVAAQDLSSFKVVGYLMRVGQGQMLEIKPASLNGTYSLNVTLRKDDGLGLALLYYSPGATVGLPVAVSNVLTVANDSGVLTSVYPSLSGNAPPGSKACNVPSDSIQEGYRPMQNNGTYGKCVPTACTAKYDLVNNVCYPIQQAVFNMQSNTVVVFSGQDFLLKAKTWRQISAGSVKVVSDNPSALYLPFDGVLNFSGANSASLNPRAMPVDRETIVHLTLVSNEGKIEASPNASLTVLVEPNGTPALESFYLDKDVYSPNDQSFTVRLTVNKPFSFTSQTRVKVDILGNKALLAQSSLKTIPLTFPKGQRTAVLNLPLSGKGSEMIDDSLKLSIQGLALAGISPQNGVLNLYVRECLSPADPMSYPFHKAVTHQEVINKQKVTYPGFLICTKEELQAISGYLSTVNPSALSMFFRQGQDIDIQGESSGIQNFNQIYQGAGFSVIHPQRVSGQPLGTDFIQGVQGLVENLFFK